MTKLISTPRDWLAVFGLLTLTVFLAACGSPGGAPASNKLQAPNATGAAGASSAETPATDSETSEVLRPGDTLTIVYNDLPILTPPFEGQIKPDGTITLILNQTFTAAGKTRAQLEQEIRERYVPKYFKNMTVTVKQNVETRMIFVGGEVRQPGRQVYLTRITVFKAIQSAGDFTEFANKKKVKLTRADGARSQMIDVTKILRDPTKDVEVYPGDTIHVYRKLW